MIPIRLIPLVWKYLLGFRLRSAFSILGVAAAMFLFHGVVAMQSGLRAATAQSSTDATLVVYRENRFCPFTSVLPESYGSEIAKVPGVRSVVPMQILVNNCRASLDVITFRGIPDSGLDSELFRRGRLEPGARERWLARTDAAVVGRRLAERRGLTTGSSLTAAGLTIYIAGIIDSDDAQDQNVAYTHLAFIQRAESKRVGTVTQFSVLVDDPSRMDEVAAAIDARFERAQAPTSTWPQKAFVARAVGDVAELVRFAAWLGLGSLVAVFALVGNAIALSVQDRIRDHAILQTLGYGRSLVARLVMAEGLLISMIGGALGLTAATLTTWFGRFTFSVEGLNIPIEAGPMAVLLGLLICAVVGLLAGLYPAWRASRIDLIDCFRAV